MRSVRKNILLIPLFPAILVCGTRVPVPATEREPAAVMPAQNSPAGDLAARLRGDPDFVDLSALPGVALDIRYATTNNFTGENLYGEFRFCFLHREAAVRLRAAVTALERVRPGWKLLVFDCLRPRSIQRRLWDRVRGGPLQSYVASPEIGSVHNFGFAVDCSLRDQRGLEVDMGTPYDAFTPLAEPRREAEQFRLGRLTRAQRENRLLLRGVMEGAGFIQLPHEWWHYDALPGATVRARYRIVE